MVTVALLIGSIELLQVLSAKLSLEGGFWDWLNNLDFGHIGYAIVTAFVTWAISIAVWKKGASRSAGARWSGTRGPVRPAARDRRHVDSARDG